MIPRIYQPIPLANQAEISLDKWGIQHLKALRLHQDDNIIIFNGDGFCYGGQITSITPKEIKIKLFSQEKPSTESSLTIHLLQAISRGERMDYTVQKATELGVTAIIPIISERCEVRLSHDRWQKRQQHWQQIAISACEQTGRTRIPTINFPTPLPDALQPGNALALVLDPEENQTLADIESYFDKKPESIFILIGPEGGLSGAEVALAKQKNFQGIRLGPRILRTETAGVTMLAALHARWGDFLL